MIHTEVKGKLPFTALRAWLHARVIYTDISVDNTRE